MTDKLFDDIIKQKADGHQSAVPPDAWDNINNKKKKRRPFIWWSLSLLILIGAAGYYMHHSSSLSNTPIAQNEQKPVSDSSILPKTNNTADDNHKQIPSTNDLKGNRSEDQATVTTNETNKPVLDTPKTAAPKPLAQNHQSITQHHYHRSITKPTTASATLLAGNNKVIHKRGLAIAHHHLKNKKGDYYAHVRVRIRHRFIAKTQTADIASNDDSTNDALPDTTTEDHSSLAKEIPAGQPALPVADTSTHPKKPLVVAATTVQQKDTAHHHIPCNLSVEAGITGILPVQQQLNIVNTERVTYGTNTKTDYNVSHEKSTIQPAIAYNIAVLKCIGEKYKIGIGFQYLELREDIDLAGLETTTTKSPIQRLVTDSSGYHLVNDTVTTTASGNRTIHAQNSYKLYSIPLIGQCMLSNHGSWSLLLDGGVYFNVASEYHNTIQGKWSTATAGTMNSSFGVDLFAGIRLSKLVLKQCSIFAEPVLRYSLLSENSFIPQKIDQLGLSVGIAYKLK